MKMSKTIDWVTLQPTWFQWATEDELRAFIRAIDNGEIPAGQKYDELKAAFDKECNRRSGVYYEHLGKKGISRRNVLGTVCL